MPTLDFLRDEAAWGDFVTRNVDPRAPNNATTRARRNRALADREAYEVARAQQEEADMQGLAMRDRNVNAYLLGQERLGMQRELHGLRKADLEAKNAASKFKASMDRQEREDIAGFTQAIMGSGHRRGTPAFAEAVAEARMKFPAVPSALFDDTWKMAGINRTPEEVQADIAARRALSPNATITATDKGTTVTDRPVPVPLTPEQMQANIDKARTVNPNATITQTQRGTTITDRPPELPKDVELDQLQDSLRLALSNQIKAEVADQPEFEPRIRTLRKRIAAREQELRKQGAPTAPSRPSLDDILK